MSTIKKLITVIFSFTIFNNVSAEINWGDVDEDINEGIDLKPFCNIKDYWKYNIQYSKIIYTVPIKWEEKEKKGKSIPYPVLTIFYKKNMFEIGERKIIVICKLSKEKPQFFFDKRYEFTIPSEFYNSKLIRHKFSFMDSKDIPSLREG